MYYMLTWASVPFARVDTFPVDIMLTHLSKKKSPDACKLFGNSSALWFWVSDRFCSV